MGADAVFHWRLFFDAALLDIQQGVLASHSFLAAMTSPEHACTLACLSGIEAAEQRRNQLRQG